MSVPAPKIPTEEGAAPEPIPLAPVAPRPARDARYDWAAERTLLSWIRTGLAMMGFGFVVARFGAFVRALGFSVPGALPETQGASASMVAGILMVALGMASTSLAVHRFLRNHRALTLGEPIDPSPAGPVAVAVFMVLLGAVLVLLLGHTLLS